MLSILKDVVVDAAEFMCVASLDVTATTVQESITSMLVVMGRRRPSD